MKNKRTITILVILIIILASIYTLITLFSTAGPGPETFTTIHGRVIETWGYGIYRNMSYEVAPQGLAHDVVTLSIGVPLLLIGLLWSKAGSFKGKFLLSGVLGFFMVTFVFFLMMAMYHKLFLLLVVLAGLSFFAFILSIIEFPVSNLSAHFPANIPARLFGGFLVFNASVISLLWLNVIIPPLIKGVIPPQVEHYTTLVVQGLDLAILLPASFISGLLLYKRKTYGLLFGPIYLVFLSLMMAALTAKLIAMASLGQEVIPAIFIIPAFMIVSVIGSVLTIGRMKQDVS